MDLGQLILAVSNILISPFLDWLAVYEKDIPQLGFLIPTGYQANTWLNNNRGKVKDASLKITGKKKNNLSQLQNRNIY